jgi:hypothetical protein
MIDLSEIPELAAEELQQKGSSPGTQGFGGGSSRSGRVRLASGVRRGLLEAD